MKAAIVEIEGASPLSFSKYYEVPKKEGEKNADYEERTWKERMHYNEEGYVIIPPMALKNCLTNAAKYLSERIEGEGKKTWTKKFEAGLMVVDPIFFLLRKRMFKVKDCLFLQMEQEVVQHVYLEFFQR